MTTQARWDPLKDLSHVQKRMNQLFENALARTDFDTQEGLDSWAPTSDVYETPEALVICLELPGLVQEDIDLRIDGDELVVEGERKMAREREGEQFHRVERSFGRFSRRFRLPSTIDRDAVQAGYRLGVLRIALPRKGGNTPKSVRVEIR